MDELLTVMLNSAGSCAQPTGGGIELTPDSSSVGPRVSPILPRPEPEPLGYTLVCLDTTVWNAEADKPARGHLFWREPRNDGIFLSESQTRYLSELFEELDALSESLRSSASAKNCRRFGMDFSAEFAGQPSIRWAIFGDEEDGVTLVVHSRRFKRQVTFEFALHGPSINIIRIDEQMYRSEAACGIDKVRQLGKAIEWLNPS